MYVGGDGFEEFYDVIPANGDGFIMTGVTTSTEDGDADVYIVRTQVNGDTLWTHCYGGDSSDVGLSICAAAGGGYLIAGATNSFGIGGSDGYLLRIDENGELLWDETVGSADDDTLRSVCLTNDGGYLAVGSKGHLAYSDVYIVRYATDSTLLPSEELAVGAPNNFSLEVYPNPFNPITTLTLSLEGTQDVQIGLYDITGRYVKDIAQGRMPAGEHSIQVDAAGLPSGVYFARAEAGAQTMTKKLVLLK
jgi:hypothetical protein